MIVMLALIACALGAPSSAYAQLPREYKDLIYATVDGDAVLAFLRRTIGG